MAWFSQGWGRGTGNLTGGQGWAAFGVEGESLLQTNPQKMQIASSGGKTNKQTQSVFNPEVLQHKQRMKY